MPVGGICVDSDVIVTAVAQGCADSASVSFIRFAVKREHHFRMCLVCVPDAVGIRNLAYAVGQFFLYQLAFVSPVAAEMAQPDIAAAYGQIARSVARQRDGFLFIVAEFCPCFDDVATFTCKVAYIDIERVGGIFQLYARKGGIAFCGLFHIVDTQFGCHVAVGMCGGKSCLGV